MFSQSVLLHTVCARSAQNRFFSPQRRAHNRIGNRFFYSAVCIRRLGSRSHFLFPRSLHHILQFSNTYLFTALMLLRAHHPCRCFSFSLFQILSFAKFHLNSSGTGWRKKWFLNWIYIRGIACTVKIEGIYRISLTDASMVLERFNVSDVFNSVVLWNSREIFFALCFNFVAQNSNAVPFKGSIVDTLMLSNWKPRTNDPISSQIPNFVYTHCTHIKMVQFNVCDPK